MDPQKLSQLDPKLREAYQRVMGTPLPPMPTSDPTSMPPQPESTLPPSPAEPDSIPAGGSAPTIEEPPQSPVSEPESVFSPISEPLTEPQPAINPQQETIPASEPTIPQQQTSNFASVNSEVSAAPIPANPVSPNFAAPAPIQAQTMAIKKKGGMLTPVMTGIAILVFIVVYTLFWTKIFNFKLPFLP